MLMQLMRYVVRIEDSLDINVWGPDALAHFVTTLARDGKEFSVKRADFGGKPLDQHIGGQE